MTQDRIKTPADFVSLQAVAFGMNISSSGL